MLSRLSTAGTRGSVSRLHVLLRSELQNSLRPLPLVSAHRAPAFNFKFNFASQHFSSSAGGKKNESNSNSNRNSNSGDGDGDGDSDAGDSHQPFYKKHPLAIAVLVATVKTATADILIQTQVEKREKIDYKRVALFTAFGSVYFGAFQYFLYVKCFSKWFDAVRLSKMSIPAIFAEGGAARANWFNQIGFDLFLHGHFFFPIYYAFKISITESPTIMEGRSPIDIASSALKKYEENSVADWIGFWKIWIPGDLIVFGMVPLWARLPVNNAISFLYVLVLSSMRGAPDSDSDGEQNLSATVTEEVTSALE